jgi:hypothetical protein
MGLAGLGSSFGRSREMLLIRELLGERIILEASYKIKCRPRLPSPERNPAHPKRGRYIIWVGLILVPMAMSALNLRGLVLGYTHPKSGES